MLPGGPLRPSGNCQSQFSLPPTTRLVVITENLQPFLKQFLFHPKSSRGRGLQRVPCEVAPPLTSKTPAPRVAGWLQHAHMLCARGSPDLRGGGLCGCGPTVTPRSAPQITQGQFDERYVLSSRVRTGRSIRGLSLPPACSRAERREVENVAITALEGLKGDLAGRYYKLSEMTEQDQQRLIDVSGP